MHKVVFRSTASTDGWPGFHERSGQYVEVIGEVSPERVDVSEVGRMFRVRFEDGQETDAFADELTIVNPVHGIVPCEPFSVARPSNN